MLSTIEMTEEEFQRILNDLVITYNQAVEILRDSGIYPADKNGNPHQRLKSLEKGFVVFIEDISKATTGNHRVLVNHCGCAAPGTKEAIKKRCARPFREMAIRWDGNVALCCNDFRGVYKCGNLLDQSFEALWNNPFFDSARKLLMHRRSFYPCSICNAISWRVGLLPDKLGKLIMPNPSSLDYGIVEEALVGGPYTKPVLRPWEIQANGSG